MSKKIPEKIRNKNEIKDSQNLLSVNGSFTVVKSYSKTPLYRFVYGSSFSLTVVLLLLLSFTLQGVRTVYADETLPITEDVPVVSEADEVTELEIIDVEPVTVDETVVEDSEAPVFTIEPEPENEIEESSDIENVIGEQTESTKTSTTTSLGNSSADPVTTSSSTATTTDGNNEIATEIQPVIESEEEEVMDDVGVEILEAEGSFISINNSDSVFTFNKDQCTKLASGSFYCLEVDENILEDALFSAPDSDGDLEIYLVRAGEQVQITHNKMDDAAPYYDMNSNTIVWHRLVDDRYQIMSYDVESKIETQLTNTSENNMEPTRQGRYTVWQRWTDGGWNIILNDGHTESQLTHSSNSNIAPYVHGTLIVWNKYNKAGEKEIEMFDIKTSTYVTVEDPDGMSVSNPRMVFVYDSLHPNGDVVTRGYDILARKFINLDTLPRELPDEIPDSESTGETRALIQSKPTVKSEGAESVDTLTATSSEPITNDIVLTASSSESMTIDMSEVVMSDDEELLTEPQFDEVVNPVISDEFDLVIEPLPDSLASTSETVQE